MAESKVLTLAQVKELAENKASCLMIINNRVYDVTKFMDEHPGGEEVMKEQHGRDASSAFEDVGHSSDAREQMKNYEIAELHPDDTTKPVKARPLIASSSGTSSEGGVGSWVKLLIPLVIVIIAILYFRLANQPATDINRPPTAI